MRAFFFRKVESVQDVTKTNEQTVSSAIILLFFNIFNYITIDQGGGCSSQGSS